MIKGALTDSLAPMVVLEISNGDGHFHPVNALLDTGFSQNLTLPPDMVARFGLEYADRIPMTLADDRNIDVSVHKGLVKWFGKRREINVIAIDGPPLLGMSLLAGCKITIRAHPAGEILIEEDR